MSNHVTPIHNSFTRIIEKDFVDLFMRLFEEEINGESLNGISDDINCYGAPHLGDFKLIERNFTQDGLSVMRNSDEPALRYLFKAWRYKNSERGLHFLRLYLRAVIGELAPEVNQLWQHKDYDYPTYLRTRQQITDEGEDINDFFLTSRIQLNINPLDNATFTKNVVDSIRTALAARFVLDLKQTIIIGDFNHGLGLAGVAGFTVNHHVKATLLTPV